MTVFEHSQYVAEQTQKAYQKMSSKSRLFRRALYRAPIGLLSDPLSARFLHLWLPSLISQPTTLDSRHIWICFKAGKWLESYLKPDMSVFEYGSGGSTLFFAKRVKSVVSVEHDSSWYDRISMEMEKQKISNCRLVLREPEKGAQPGQPYTSTRKGNEGYSFERYVNAIGEYPDASFDFVLVDGRARMSCISNAVRKVKIGGYLMLDDSQRPNYASAESLLKGHLRRDFRGLKACQYRLSQASIWKIRKIPDA
jgi:hypothetical protein